MTLAHAGGPPAAPDIGDIPVLIRSATPWSSPTVPNQPTWSAGTADLDRTISTTTGARLQRARVNGISSNECAQAGWQQNRLRRRPDGTARAIHRRRTRPGRRPVHAPPICGAG